MQPIRWIDQSLTNQLLQKASTTTRLRLNHNFHYTMEENPHRFLNALTMGTYIRPHRHLFPPKPESFVLLQGALIFLIFDDTGKVNHSRVLASADLLTLMKESVESPTASLAELEFQKQYQRLKPNMKTMEPAFGVDIDPGLWHTLLPLTEHCVIFEVKPGPYHLADDKEFATWAPTEADSNVSEYLQSLYSFCFE